jgi:hypothetical protein
MGGLAAAIARNNARFSGYLDRISSSVTLHPGSAAKTDAKFVSPSAQRSKVAQSSSTPNGLRNSAQEAQCSGSVSASTPSKSKRIAS